MSDSGYNRDKLMALPPFLQPYLPSYDISRLGKNDLVVRRELITQILNLGDETAVKWLFGSYALSEIKKAVRYPMRGMWLRRSLNYWETIFSLEITKDVYELALIDLRPRPHLYEKFFKLEVSS